MPPRSVCLNVFTTARGLGRQRIEEVSEVQVPGEEENANSVLQQTKGGIVEGRNKLHGKHDSMQFSQDEPFAVATTYNSLTKSITPTPNDNISPLTLTPASTNLAAPLKFTTYDELTATADSLLTSETIKSVRTCNNCGCTPTTADATLKQCSRCKLTLYCSTKCQKSDWPVHKKSCILSRAELAPAVDGNRITTDTLVTQDEREAAELITPNVSGSSTPISPFEDGTTSTAATSPGLYFEYKTELLNGPFASHASASIPPCLIE